VTSSSVATGGSIPLQCTGFDFSLALSGSGTQTVAGGTTASYTLALTPLGSSGTFAFACDALPKAAFCLFSPPGETLAAGVTRNVTVSVSTGSPTGSLRPGPPAWWTAVPVVCGVLMLPWGRRRRGWLRISLGLAMLIVAAMGLSSCASSGGGTGGGGTGGGSGGSGQTRPGTYSIPLTATSSGVSHSVTVTLVVD
jgi:hypothetical protein